MSQLKHFISYYNEIFNDLLIFKIYKKYSKINNKSGFWLLKCLQI